jgi:hypothetical protein
MVDNSPTGSEKPPVRAGWADASRELAELGDDDLVWPEFPYEADEILTW